MPDLTTADIVLLGAMLPLLVVSAFFSASETVFFGLGVEHRAVLRQRGGLIDAAAETLLHRPQQLLVTVLLGNMTINTLFMTVSAVVLLRHEDKPLAGGIFVVFSLMLLIVFGEILPKIAGQTHRVGAASFLGPPLAAIHRAIAPLRILISRFVVTPLARLAGEGPKLEIGADELAALLDVSLAEGAIDRSEERVLREVVKMGDLSVRDIMTPRVHVEFLEHDDDAAAIRATIARTGLSRLPVVGESIDDIRGVLSCRRFLMNTEGGALGSLAPIAFVPEQASVEHLLGRFRDEGSTIAVVVDEYGGTAGIVTIEDVAEEIVGEIAEPDERLLEVPERLGEARWRVSGLMPLHDWREAFGEEFDDRRVSTVGGLFFVKLGRLARQGDVVRLANVRLVAEHVEDGRVASAVVDLVREQGVRR
jgi:CBS domain containing-hemolysin-like protein